MTKNFDKVRCEICGEEMHFLEPHLGKAHNLTVGAYQYSYPGKPVVSEAGKEKLAAVNANPKIDGNIKKLFGVSINKSVLTIPMFSKPQPTTPAIDPEFVFDKESLMVALYVVANNNTKRAMYVGPTGCGKTTGIEQVAARLNWGWTRLNLDSNITRDALIGTWKLNEHSVMVWQDGLLTNAMRHGHLTCIDEIDGGDPSVTMCIQSILEGRPLTIPETGEVVPPHTDFRLFATGNTGGQGDATGLYNGTQVQNFATMDRFNLTVECDYPNKASETKILKGKTGIDDPMILDKMTEVASLVRTAFKKGDMVATMSTRTVVEVGKALCDFGDVNMAYRLAFVNKLNSDDRTLVKELIQRVWGKVAA